MQSKNLILSSNPLQGTETDESTRTPVHLAAYSDRDLDTYAGLTDVMDTFRVLMNSIDFSVEDANGWQILIILCWDVLHSHEDLRATCDLLLWMLQILRFELRTYLNRSKYAEMFGKILESDPDLAGAVDLLFNLSDPSIIEANTTGNFSKSFVLQIALARADHEDCVSTVLAQGPNLHRLCFPAGITPYVESPTSLAMHSSMAFGSWLHALVKTGLDIGSFIDQELVQNPQVHVGWEKETLLDLFTHGDRPDLRFKSRLICSDCECWPEFYGQMKQPHWMHLLEKIKKGLYLYDPAPTKSNVNEDENADLHSVGNAHNSLTDLTSLADTTEDDSLGNLGEVLSELRLKDHTIEHSEISQIELDYGKDETVCDYCWLSYKRTGIRGLRKALPNRKNTSLSDDSSENEYSPFHIHS